jgi:propionate CoA-transferase
VVNYDSFSLGPEAVDDYIAALRGLAERYYAGVTRYTTSSFLRLKLGQTLAGRDVAPHIYEGRTEAMTSLRR